MIKIIKIALGYDETEKVSFKEYIDFGKKNKLYILHPISLIFFYSIFIASQILSGSINYFAILGVGFLYIFLEYINILVWRRSIIVSRKNESDGVNDG